MPRKRKSEQASSLEEINPLQRPTIWSKKSVKCHFAQFCKLDGLRNALRSKNIWFSKLVIHVHNVVTIYLNENEGSIFPGDMNPVTAVRLENDFWDKSYSIVRACLEGRELNRRKTDSEQSWRVKTAIYDICVRYCEDSGIARDWPPTAIGCKVIVQAQRRISATNHRNHLDKYHVYLGRFVHYCLQSEDSAIGQFVHLFRSLSRKQYNFVFGRVMQLLEEEEEGITMGTVLSRFKESSKQGIEDSSEIWDVVEYFVSDILIPYYYHDGIKGEKYDCQARSIMMYQMLQDLESHGQAMRALVEERRRRVETFDDQEIENLYAQKAFARLANRTWTGKNAAEFRALYDGRNIDELYRLLRQKKEENGELGNRERLSRAETIAYDVIQKFIRRRDGQNSESPRQRKQNKWAFDLCPQASFRPKYIPISTTALIAIVKSLSQNDREVKESLDRVKDKIKDDVSNMEERGIDPESDLGKHLQNFRYWDEFFCLTKVMNKPYPEVNAIDFLIKCRDSPDDVHKAMRFGNSISTDGYGMSAVVEHLLTGIGREIHAVGCKKAFLEKKLKDSKNSNREEKQQLDQFKKDLESLREQRKQQMYSVPLENKLEVKQIFHDRDIDKLQTLAKRWAENRANLENPSQERCQGVESMLDTLNATIQEITKGDNSVPGRRMKMQPHVDNLKSFADDCAKTYESETVVKDMGTELKALLEEIVNTTMIFETNRKIIGIDAGKAAIMTASVHDTDKQIIHMSNRKTTEEERFKILGIPNGRWREIAGLIGYTRLMNKRIMKFIPNVRHRPTTKTTDTDRIFSSFRFMNQQWDGGEDATETGGLNAAFFDTSWYRKQKMVQYSRRQTAIDYFVMFILTGEEDKRKQKLSDAEAKKIIVAYGDACPRHNVKGAPPAPNMPFFRRFKEKATCVLVGEFRTSKNCSSCLQEMKQMKLHRLKRCKNNACPRDVWNRDNNASISIPNLMLWTHVHGDRPKAFSRKVQNRIGVAQ